MTSCSTNRRFASTDVATAVNRLGEHQLNWSHCEIAGHVTPAVWTAFDTAIRLLENDGRYVRGYVQLAGPALVSGASAAQTTAAWNSDQLALTGTPARVDNPRTGAATTWMTVEDPIQGRNRVLPATYGLVASMSARQIVGAAGRDEARSDDHRPADPHPVAQGSSTSTRPTSRRRSATARTTFG